MRDDLGGREGDSQRRDPEVVAAQPQDRKTDDAGERSRDHDRQADGERDVLLVRVLPQHRRRIGADAEEDDVAEADVAGIAADDIPGTAQRREHEDAAAKVLDVAVVEERNEPEEREDCGRDGERGRIAGDPAQADPLHAAAFPMIPVGRNASTSSKTTSATALGTSEPIYCEPNDPMIP